MDQTFPIPGRIGTLLAAAAPNRNEMDLEYAARALNTLVSDPADLAAWCTDRCPECEVRMEFGGPVTPPLLWAFKDHLMIGTLVVVGCQGYWVISPDAVGMPGDQSDWDDWCMYPWR